MRYVVVGAGAVGGTVGGRLYDAGHDVVLVARGAHAAAMQRDGLRLALPDRVLTVRAPVAASIHDVRFTSDDVVLLATKTQDTAAALDRLVEAARGVPIVCVQNGVANERMALQRFDAVYGVVVMLPAVLLEPGRIDAQGQPFTGLLDIGRAPAGIDELAKHVAADLSASGFASQPQPEIMRWKYAKLLRNLGNAIEALCGHDVDGDELAAVGELDRRMREEAVACFVAAGVAWTSDEEWVERRQEQVQHTPVEGRTRAGGSTWQSLARGAGSVEVDYLNGEICLLGREHGIPTPINAMVQRLMTRAASSGAQPGSMRPTELLAQADIVTKESSHG
jgi:2-dehydropantoate 2-reductase